MKISIIIIFGLLLVVIIIRLYIFYKKNKTEGKHLGNEGFARMPFANNRRLIQSHHFKDKDYSIFHISKKGDIYVKDFRHRSYEIFKFDSEKLTVNLPSEINNENIYNIDIFKDSIVDISCNNDHIIWSLPLHSSKIQNQYILPNYFARALRIDENSFVSLLENQDSTATVFFSHVKFESSEKPEINPSNFFLKSAMIEDGYLLKNMDDFIYVHSYNNQTLKLSNNLKRIEYFNTVDTIETLASKQKINRGQYSYTKSHSPSRWTNKSAVTYKNMLFVHSLVLSNDPENEAEKSIIDVYSIEKKTYEGSLYIADDNKNKMSEFFIENSFLVVLYINEMKLYEFIF